MMTGKRKSKRVSSSYCIVASNVVAKKLSGIGMKDQQTLMLGTLVLINKPIDDKNVAVNVINHEEKYDISEENLWICPMNDLLSVDKIMWPLISAIVSPIERVKVLKDSELCQELSTIEVGNLVNLLPIEDKKDIVIAIVKYKGPILKKGPGIYFGLELLEASDEPGTDGTFGGQRLFSCPAGTGMFVAVNRIRLTSSPMPVQDTSTFKPKPRFLQIREKFENMSRKLPVHSTIQPRTTVLDTLEPALCLDDRVIWFSKAGPVTGIVKWISEQDNQTPKVGVQFDESFNGDGGKNLPLTLPADVLVKADDYYGAYSECDKIRSNARINGNGSLSAKSKMRCSDSFHWNNLLVDLTPEKSSSFSSSSNPHSREIETNQDLCDFLSQPADRAETRTACSADKLSKLNNFTSVDNTNPANLIADDCLSCASEGSSYYDTPEPAESLEVGSVVEVAVRGEPHYGVIRWIGIVPGDKRPRRVAGIEMEEECVGHSDGTFNGRRYFQCNPQRALFVNLNQCRKDSRFQESRANPVELKAKEFGQVDCPVIPGIVHPISRERDIDSLCGKYRGIQGHHNSCYLDATLFSMFTFTSVFDSLLYRPAGADDVAQYGEVQRVLREEIVNPLRENLYVRADRVMKLRQLLENLSSVTGLTTEEKDPEEFLQSLVAQILRAEPLLKLSSGQEAFHYQLFVEKDEQLMLPTVQQLFEQSFLSSDIKLKEVPSCLIIQMPRFGKNFKMYPRILPSQLLDVTDVIENSPRQCTVCGKLAKYECKECFDQCEEGLQSIAFCDRCLETAHCHERRSEHVWRELRVPGEYSALQEHCVIPRLFMELFAVVCIETSHYVAFVKCGTGSDAPWCFFDSMADRKGEQNGYNIPEVVPCANLPYWLSEKGSQMLQQVRDDRQLPEHAKRLLCDAYMCMYQSSEVMMYR